jgi:hypothetical protein
MTGRVYQLRGHGRFSLGLRRSRRRRARGRCSQPDGLPVRHRASATLQLRQPRCVGYVQGRAIHAALGHANFIKGTLVRPLFDQKMAR